MIAAIIAMMLITAAVMSAPALASLTGAALAVGEGRGAADGEVFGETLGETIAGETLADGEGAAVGDALGFGVGVAVGFGEGVAAVTVIFALLVYSQSPSSLLNRQATDQPFMSRGTFEMVNSSPFPPLTRRLGK